MQKLQWISLKTEYQENPVGIDVQMPVFTWNVSVLEENWEQDAYQIVATHSEEDIAGEEKLIWDSGKVVGSQMYAAYRGIPLQSNKTYFWKIRVWEKGVDTPSEYSPVVSWRMGLISPEDWKGTWLGVSKKQRFMPLYRYNFKTKKKIRKAYAYICGLGHYECYLNGQKVGDRVLEPGWTDYRKTCFYNTYDITDCLIEGKENTVGIMLGNGMYHVEAGQPNRYVYYPRSYGQMKFIFQAEIEYQDGDKEQLISSPKWKVTPGPITYSAMYGGEDYDARLEIPGWCSPETVKEEGWEAAEQVIAPEGKLRAQKNPPLKVMEQFTGHCIKKNETTLLYDFGQNFSGYVEIKVKGFRGQTIVMTPGEILDQDMKPDQRITGKDYYWKYTIGSDKEECFSPRFTYYGFRYVEIQGEQNRMPEILSVTGQYIYPDIERAGEFSCSNQLFNQIHKIINEAMKSNIKSVLTDCPHREKFGWLEQIHLIGPSLLFNYDLRNLYLKQLGDMQDAQHEDGLIADIAPEYAVFGYHEGFIDSPEWGSAGVIVPWYLYKQYGDISVIETYYEMMKKYVAYLAGKTHHKILHHGLGDWCDLGARPPFTQNTPVPIVATAMYYMDLEIMKNCATLLDKKEDIQIYMQEMQEVKNEFNLQFYDGQTAHYGTGSQAAQGMALMAGISDETERLRILTELIANIRANQNGTTAGDVGHPYVLAALTQMEHSEVINDMMNVTERPGYGYQVINGATTLAEEWDGPTPGHMHGSQNHFMLGSGDEWFYSGLAGFRNLRSDMEPGQIKIAPHFADGVDWVKAWHQHPHGKVSVEWKRRGENKVKMKVNVPANLKVTVEIAEAVPDGIQKEVGSGTYQWEFEIAGKQQ